MRCCQLRCRSLPWPQSWSAWMIFAGLFGQHGVISAQHTGNIRRFVDRGNSLAVVVLADSVGLIADDSCLALVVNSVGKELDIVCTTFSSAALESSRALVASTSVFAAQMAE